VDELETIAGVLIHGGSEDNVAALAMSLGLVHGGSASWRSSVKSLLVLSQTTTRRSRAVRGVYREGERLIEHGEKALGHVLGLIRSRDPSAR